VIPGPLAIVDGMEDKGPRPVESGPLTPVNGQMAVRAQHEGSFRIELHDMESALGLWRPVRYERTDLYVL